jgi:hypothetical protein
MEQDDAARKRVEKEIDEQGVRLQEDLRNRKTRQENLAFTLARISPASAYQLASMAIAGTDIALKSRYEDALRAYRTVFNAFTEKKQKESGDVGGIRITMDSEKGISISSPRDQGTLRLDDMPAFSAPAQASAVPLADLGLLVAAVLAAVIGAFAGFMRYDMRS